MRIVPRIPALLFASASLFAAFLALRLAYAAFLFHSGQPEAIAHAAAIVPSNATYAYRAGNLQRAVELNPYLSSAWLELALAAESAGNLTEAERLFLRAAQVDRTFEPRWALANFYFRRQTEGAFWQWLRLAAERSYGDRTALFRLAWRFTSDSGTILNQGIPARPEFAGLYLDFLRTEGKWEAAVEAAAMLAPIARPLERGKLLELSETLVQQGEAAGAVRVWNLWDPRRSLDPVAGRSLTNAALDTEPLGKGFDWRLPWREGVTHVYSAHSREIRITLDGRQHEGTPLLEQLAPVVPSAGYRFQFRHRAVRIPARSGIRWEIRCPSGGSVAEIPITSLTDVLTDAAAEVAVPAGCRLLRLTLVYRRLPGTVRPEGDFFVAGPFQLARTR